MPQCFDAIVLGSGGVGSAALFHLALRGCRVLGLDRFAAGHDRGSSHGHTRVIRQAYFEHPDYVPLVQQAYRHWLALEHDVGQKLYCETGLLQVGRAAGAVVRGTLAAAERHRLDVAQLSPHELEQRFPGFAASDDAVGLFEQRAGYLRVEDCVRAHLSQAIRCGAQLQSDVAVRSWRCESNAVIVETDRASFAAARLVIAAGAWSTALLADLKLPLTVRRKAQFWYATDEPAYQNPAPSIANSSRPPARTNCPVYLFETPQGIFYGVPQIDARGLKVAEHTGGQTVDDPSTVDRSLEPAEQQRVEAFLAVHLPKLRPALTGHSVCMYTMTPDQHFIVDRHPAHEPIVFAAGLSGHGFKFTPVLGQALAELTLEGRTELPIGFWRLDRPALAARGNRR